MSSKKFVQIHEGYRVPEEEYEAHMARMAQEAKAEKRSDMMTSIEEQEWDNAARTRAKLKLN